MRAVQLVLWETEVGGGELVARRPVAEGSMTAALRALGLRDTPGNRKLLHGLRRAGRVSGWKPGAVARGQEESNARVVWDLGSVLEWRERCGGKRGKS